MDLLKEDIHITPSWSQSNRNVEKYWNIGKLKTFLNMLSTEVCKKVENVKTSVQKIKIKIKLYFEKYKFCKICKMSKHSIYKNKIILNISNFNCTLTDFYITFSKSH